MKLLEALRPIRVSAATLTEANSQAAESHRGSGKFQGFGAGRMWGALGVVVHPGAGAERLSVGTSGHAGSVLVRVAPH